MKAFVDGGRGETKYLQNDFDLEQLRKQHDIFFKSLMSELGIAEVFYNPALSTGATSGAAYRRLMSMTLNEVDRMKRRLEPFIKKLVYTMLELGKNNNLITSEAEYPSVQFEDGLIDDENEKLQMLVTKYSNNFIPLKEAIMQSNNLDEIQAQSYIDDINQANVEAIALNQENQANITDSATPASVTE